MKKNWLWIASVIVFAVGCSSSSGGSDTTGTSTGTTSSTTGSAPATTASYADVQAIFTKNCVGCHGADHPKGGINLTDHDSVMKGGEDGPIVTAGDPDKSKLVDALLGRNGAMQMPKNASPLPDADIKKIEAWIKDGAKA